MAVETRTTEERIEKIEREIRSLREEMRKEFREVDKRISDLWYETMAMFRWVVGAWILVTSAIIITIIALKG